MGSARKIRAADWHAELEVRARDGSWRADVLASSHEGTQRVAWEAQLSPISHEDIQERTERYWAEGIGVCWVSPGGKAPWMGTVPSIRVQEPCDDRPWTVVDGPAAFRFEHGTWVAVDDLELTAFIRWVLNGQTIIHRVRPRYRRVWFGASESYRRRHLIWTTSSYVDTEARHEAMRQRQDERKRLWEEQQRRAEEQRQAEAGARRQEEERQREAQRQELERQRKIRETEQAARWEEQRKQWGDRGRVGAAATRSRGTTAARAGPGRRGTAPPAGTARATGCEPVLGTGASHAVPGTA
ncbi:competence protein CoiA family protein [Salinispora arenicola]|uniref:competence protein CoiA family protein n=1 Tax=Salinispora arenicola TaxID=168697 RepID=UPI0003A2BB47|nr:competence protein CoiA family protein [Salinispora arenicola]